MMKKENLLLMKMVMLSHSMVAASELPNDCRG